MFVCDGKYINNGLNAEYRNGFYVDEKRKKIWAVELDLYKKFHEVCLKYDINYCASGGTMLGAIRHKGFIPWDDDFDVCMDRDNFNKLIAVESEFEYPYFLQHALNDRKYFIGYARLRNSETTGAIKSNYSKEYNNGIYIDIFCFDGIINNKLLLFIQLLIKKIICKLIAVCQKLNITNNNFIYVPIVKAYNFVLSLFNKKSTYISALTHNSDIVKKSMINKESINKFIITKFENISIRIPLDFDSYLNNMYKNYMDFPPTNERGTWHSDILIFEPDESYIQYMNKYKTFNR